jgi:hypothetical protein
LVAKCGGSTFPSRAKQYLLSHVAKLDETELTIKQCGWASLWYNTTRLHAIRTRSHSIVDRAMLMLKSDASLVPALVDILTGLSREKLLEETIVIRMLDVSCVL